MGLRNEDVPTLFKWSDHSAVVFTYWDQNEPKVPFNSTPNCVSYSGEVGIQSWVFCCGGFFHHSRGNIDVCESQGGGVKQITDFISGIFFKMQVIIFYKQISLNCLSSD